MPERAHEHGCRGSWMANERWGFRFGSQQTPLLHRYWRRMAVGTCMKSPSGQRVLSGFYTGAGMHTHARTCQGLFKNGTTC